MLQLCISIHFSENVHPELRIAEESVCVCVSPSLSLSLSLSPPQLFHRMLKLSRDLNDVLLLLRLLLLRLRQEDNSRPALLGIGKHGLSVHHAFAWRAANVLYTNLYL